MAKLFTVADNNQNFSASHTGIDVDVDVDGETEAPRKARRVKSRRG